MPAAFLATGIAASADTASPFAALSYTLPADTKAGDLLIACYGGKPYDTVPSTPSGYTARSGGANGTTAMGSGAGSVYAVAFTKTHSGSESNPSSTFSAQYSPGVRAMVALRDPDTTAWTVTSCKGSDSTATGTGFSATGDATLGYSVGDVVVVLLVHNDDSSSSSSFGLSITGCTLGTVTQRLTGTLTTATGNDARMYVLTATVTAGTATAAPVVTATTGSGDADGQAVFLCCRSDAKAIRPPERLTANQRTGTDTLSDTTGFSTDSQTTVASSTAYARTGSRSLELTAINNYDVGCYTDGLFPVSPGETCTISGWMRKAAAVASGHGLWSYLNIYWLKDDLTASATASSWTGTVEATDTWQQVTADFTVPSDARFAYLYAVNQNSISSGDKFYWDDFSVLMPPVPITGSITLGGSTAWTAEATGSITLGGEAEAEEGGVPTPATATGSLTLGATAAAVVTATATGSLTLGGSAAWVVPQASGGLTLSVTVAAAARATAAGSITLDGSGHAQASALASGSIALAGYSSAAESLGVTGSLALSGAATVSTLAVASGSVTLAGSTTGGASATSTGSLTLGGTAAASAAGSLLATVSLSGLVDAAAAVATQGLIDLIGDATATATPTASGLLDLSGDVEVATLPGIMQQASAAVATLTAVRVIAPTVLGIDAAAPALAPASAVTATMTGTTTTTATIERS